MNPSESRECPDLFFARDHLDSAEVQAHLRDCEVCRTLLTMTRTERPASFADDCIADIAPLLAILGTGQLGADDRQVLADHLDSCRDCAAAATADRPAVPPPAPARHRRAGHGAALAAAALVVAAAILLVIWSRERTERNQPLRVSAADDSGHPAQRPAPGAFRVISASRQLQVTARLVDIRSGLPDCGTLAISVTAKYQVIEVHSGAYSEPVLYVNHLCPELSRQLALGAAGGSLQGFQVGDIHRLQLRRADVPSSAGDLVSGESSFDDYGDPDLARYWADRTDLVGAAKAKPADQRCLPVVAAECGCVYSCGAGTRDSDGSYRVTHSFWKDTVLRAKIADWCVDGECTEAFFAEIICDGLCPSRPADPTCHFEAGQCVGESAPAGNQATPAKKVAAVDSTDLVVEARLRHQGRGPLCGTMAIAETLEYDVVKVRRGNYAEKRIYVIQRCPTFSTGEVYLMELSGASPSGSDLYLVIDEFEQIKSDRYWAVKTTRVP